MKEYLKKFDSAEAADNYHIVDIPFATSVATIPIQNLVCNKTDKHLENDSGTVIIMPPDPIGPADNEIWYWGEYYDLANAISVLEQQDISSYVGPAILSNERVENKYVITFDDSVTKLGINIDPKELYPVFTNDSESGITCNITRIEIPNSVTSIGASTFASCSSLTSIIIPDNVPNIGDGAFASCSGLTSVTIPNSVTSIGAYAFVYCSSLTSIIIPDNVVNIRDGAFENCSSLTSLVCKATTPPTLSMHVFDGTNDCLIYVPSQSVEAYKTAENWSEYASRIQAIPQQS